LVAHRAHQLGGGGEGGVVGAAEQGPIGEVDEPLDFFVAGVGVQQHGAHRGGAGAAQLVKQVDQVAVAEAAGGHAQAGRPRGGVVVRAVAGGAHGGLDEFEIQVVAVEVQHGDGVLPVLVLGEQLGVLREPGAGHAGQVAHEHDFGNSPGGLGAAGRVGEVDFVVAGPAQGRAVGGRGVVGGAGRLVARVGFGSDRHGAGEKFKQVRVGLIAQRGAERRGGGQCAGGPRFGVGVGDLGGQLDGGGPAQGVGGWGVRLLRLLGLLGRQEEPGEFVQGCVGVVVHGKSPVGGAVGPRVVWVIGCSGRRRASAAAGGGGQRCVGGRGGCGCRGRRRDFDEVVQLAEGVAFDGGVERVLHPLAVAHQAVAIAARGHVDAGPPHAELVVAGHGGLRGVPVVEVAGDGQGAGLGAVGLHEQHAAGGRADAVERGELFFKCWLGRGGFGDRLGDRFFGWCGG